ncbi:MAG: Fe-S cluster assembly protein SufB, partial [Bacilli bacterium]
MESVKQMPKGLTKNIVSEISSIKGEPTWMRDYRLTSYEQFRKMPLPSFGPQLNIDLNEITYFKRIDDKVHHDWNEVDKD